MTDDRRTKQVLARGLRLAALVPIREARDGWIVPSEEGGASYYVRRTRVGLRCTCDDFVLRGGALCKHVCAVGYFRKREEGAKLDPASVPPPLPKKSYAQDWSNYGAFQETEKRVFHPLLNALVAPLSGKPASRLGGRPRIPLRDIMYCAIAKVECDFSARRAMPGLEIARERGYIDTLPAPNSILYFMGQPWITPILEELVTLSCRPLRAVDTTFAVDSTGFGTRMYFRHRTKNAEREILKQDYVKLHAAVSTATHAITAAIVTDRKANDSPFFKPLLERTAKLFTIGEVTADKAYLSAANLALVDKLGGRAYIPFKKNSTEKEKPGLWNTYFREFNTDRDAFLSRYHRRSNVESTFSALKRRYKEFVRHRSLVSQSNELLMKVIAYNISRVTQAAFERGVDPSFDQALPKYGQLPSAL